MDNQDAKEHKDKELAAAQAKGAKKCDQSGSCTLPETQHLKIRVSYLLLFVAFFQAD